MGKIKSIYSREILNSAGEPSLETEITLVNGLKAKASVPSGTSLSSYEAKELRDGDSRRFQGRGVLQAVNKVNEVIAPALSGMEVSKQAEIDKKLIELDGKKDKSSLGANSILSVSLAVARLAALDKGVELYEYLAKTYVFKNTKIPVPMFNIFNGGLHADTNLDFQEFLYIPSAKSAKEMVRQGAEVFKALKYELKASGYDTDVGLEGGYAPDIDSSVEAMELIMAASLNAGYEKNKDFHLGIDVGSSVLFDQSTGRYVFPLDKAYFSADNLMALYETWLKRYPINYLEDALVEDDFENWQKLTQELGSKLLICGDDLFSTNLERLRKGLAEKAANAIIIKPNQVGTLTETVDVIKLAISHNYRIIVSHRSQETNDDFIVDLAVACGADFIKAGSLARGERVAKYNRLMQIADDLDK